MGWGVREGRRGEGGGKDVGIASGDGRWVGAVVTCRDGV